MLRRTLLAAAFLTCSVPAAANCIAPTFDDGPHPTHTPRLLDILKAERVRVTFCVVGRLAKAHPDIIRRMRDEGHQLCNHSMNHPYVVGVLSDAELKYEFGETDKLLQEIADVFPQVIRTPGGGVRDRVGALMHRRVVRWDIDPKDFWNRDPRSITSYVLAQAAPGKIVLLHDIYQSTVNAAPSMIRGFRAKGLQPVTLEKLWSEECGDTLQAQAG